MIPKGRLYETFSLEFILFGLRLSPLGLWESLKEHFVIVVAATTQRSNLAY